MSWWRGLVDRREPGRIRHTLATLLGQRIFNIAFGHPYGNDANHLVDDPIHKLLLRRDRVVGEALASEPTLSRFENGVGRSGLYELGRELAMRVIKRHQRRLDRRARRITIDLDPTDDATHGAQQLTFFNGHYDCWCYLPLLVFLTFDQERGQICAHAVLPPGNVPPTRGTVGLMCRLLPLLRHAFRSISRSRPVPTALSQLGSALTVRGHSAETRRRRWIASRCLASVGAA